MRGCLGCNWWGWSGLGGVGRCEVLFWWRLGILGTKTSPHTRFGHEINEQDGDLAQPDAHTNYTIMDSIVEDMAWWRSTLTA